MVKLNNKVLLLNNSYEPISIIPAKKAIIMYFLEKVDVVKKSNVIINSLYIKLNIPDVIKLKKYIYIKHSKIPLTRKNILKRDNNICQYCGKNKSEVTIDHVVPKDKGGKDEWRNLVAACKRCNMIKGNYMLKDIDMNLIRKPFEPSQIIYLQNIGRSNKAWHPYLYLTNRSN